jgi:hypothetical protein
MNEVPHSMNVNNRAAMWRPSGALLASVLYVDRFFLSALSEWVAGFAAFLEGCFMAFFNLDPFRLRPL